MKKIIINNISLKFRLYHDGGTSLKECFSNIFRNNGRKSYTDFFALKEVSFSVGNGERIGIIGRNGAGKSTLLRTIARIYQPLSGSVSIHGCVAPLLEIGAGFHPEFTGRENIYFNGAILGYSKMALKEMEAEIISFAELDEFIDSPVKYYSTGMHMRLAFSLATAIKPDILILDELFVGGDASFVEKGRKRMNDMLDKSNVMIMVSHDAEMLRSLCDRFIWLDHGRLIADGGVSVLDRYISS